MNIMGAWKVNLIGSNIGTSSNYPLKSDITAVPITTPPTPQSTIWDSVELNITGAIPEPVAEGDSETFVGGLKDGIHNFRYKFKVTTSRKGLLEYEDGYISDLYEFTKLLPYKFLYIDFCTETPFPYKLNNYLNIQDETEDNRVLFVALVGWSPNVDEGFYTVEMEFEAGYRNA